ncbi:nuclear transport factor 2 family protein [Nitrosopumilus sp.]|uniref:nuclear transport factor 2 family protein n=1 Tax=Nitrosopumilus sp. TaxID=2024843 RepID=UPI0034A0967E
MSNKELIKKFYIAFKNKDMQTISQVCDKAIEWNTLKGMPHGGKYVGLKAIFEDYFSNMLSNFEEFHAIPEEYIESKNHVTVIGKYQGISKTGKDFDVPFSHVYHMQGNKIKQFRQFTDTKIIQDTLS